MSFENKHVFTLYRKDQSDVVEWCKTNFGLPYANKSIIKILGAENKEWSSDGVWWYTSSYSPPALARRHYHFNNIEHASFFKLTWTNDDE